LIDEEATRTGRSRSAARSALATRHCGCGCSQRSPSVAPTGSGARGWSPRPLERRGRCGARAVHHSRPRNGHL